MTSEGRAADPHQHHHAHGPANRRRWAPPTAAPLFVRLPEQPPEAGAVVLHDVHGLTETVEQRCRELARRGYVAVAPYLYYATGGREYSLGDERAARAAVQRLSPDDLAADIGGALDHLRSRLGIAAAATGVVGFGVGAHLASWAATRYSLAASVAFEPDGVRAAPWRGVPGIGGLLVELRTPWLGVVASRSDATELDQVVGREARRSDVDIVDIVDGADVVDGDGCRGWDAAVRFLDARTGW